jgi:hypothetical protein
MSNRNYPSCAASRVPTIALLVCVLPMQFPGTCACRVLETPCTTECQCAAQTRSLARQCHRSMINDLCDVHRSADAVDHSRDNSNRECRCLGSPQMALTRIKTPIELNLNCQILLHNAELFGSPQESQLKASSDLTTARQPHTSLERRVFMCRLTL